jgi:hypothetical protein
LERETPITSATVFIANSPSAATAAAWETVSGQFGGYLSSKSRKPSVLHLTRWKWTLVGNGAEVGRGHANTYYLRFNR